MGTDVVMLIEKKSKIKDSKWEIDKQHGILDEDYKDFWKDGRVNLWRHYRLFAVLAGVRNGEGFAGCYNHNPIKPIAEPRGFPEDAGKHVMESIEYEHDISWLTLKDFKDYDWKQKLIYQVYFSLSDYKEFKKVSNIEEKLRFNNVLAARKDNPIEIISLKKANERIKDGFVDNFEPISVLLTSADRMCDTYFQDDNWIKGRVFVKWKENFGTLEETVYSGAIKQVVDRLEVLEKEGYEARIVFGFNS